jgi:hypothetical protein
MPKLADILDAIEYVSGAPRGENCVVCNKRTSQFLYASEMSGENEIPDGLDWDEWVEIPHKHDLHLGQQLVYRFILEHLPDEADTARRIFRRRGAYRRFKDFLEDHQMLQQWYDFQDRETRIAVEQWCNENGIEIEPQAPSTAKSDSAKT